MGQIGVDLDHHVVAEGEAGGEGLAVRAPEPHLAGPAQDIDPADLGRERLGLLGRAVGALVVDHDDVAAGSASRIRRTTRSMFSASLYVGIVTHTFVPDTFVPDRSHLGTRVQRGLRGPRATANRTGVVGRMWFVTNR